LFVDRLTVEVDAMAQAPALGKCHMGTGGERRVIEQAKMEAVGSGDQGLGGHTRPGNDRREVVPGIRTVC
jgi:hypothetical protein